MPMLCAPDSGSRLRTNGNVMNRPPSPGQHLITGKSDRFGAPSTTRCAGTLNAPRGRTFIRLKMPLRFCQRLAGVGGLIRSNNASSSSPICSGCLPRPISIRSIVAKRLIASGYRAPLMFVNSSAGPSSRTARVAISVTSSSGSTSTSTTRSRSLRRSSRRKSCKSVYAISRYSESCPASSTTSIPRQAFISPEPAPR